MPTNTQPAAGSSSPSVSLINANVATIVAGAPVYNSASGYCDKALGDSAAHARVIGLALADIAPAAAGLIQVASIITLTAAQWDAVCGTSGGLAFGTDYYLSASATSGRLTSTAPVSAGKYVTLVGTGLSATQMKLSIQPSIGPIVQ